MPPFFCTSDRRTCPGLAVDLPIRSCSPLLVHSAVRGTPPPGFNPIQPQPTPDDPMLRDHAEGHNPKMQKPGFPPGPGYSYGTAALGCALVIQIMNVDRQTSSAAGTQIKYEIIVSYFLLGATMKSEFNLYDPQLRCVRHLAVAEIYWPYIVAVCLN